MSAAKQIHITQGTPEWHDWRKKGIGASDVAALFGKSPYKTKRDLWFEKAGLGEPDDEDRSYIFRRGHEAEADLRELFIKHAQAPIEPACFEKDEIFLASLDGYLKAIAVFEFKLVGAEALKKAKESGEIPDHHWVQIQSQLHASDSDKGFWGGKAPKVKGGIVVEIGRDEKFIKLIREMAEEFMESIRANKVPDLSDQDTLFLSKPEHVALFAALKRAKSEKERIESEFKDLEEKAKALAAHARVRCNGVLITEVLRSGSVDYLKIPEVKALTEEYIESFRKRSSKHKMMRFPKAE